MPPLGRKEGGNEEVNEEGGKIVGEVGREGMKGAKMGKMK